MTEYRRIYRPGACYFFTAVTYNRRPLLIDHIERLVRAGLGGTGDGVR